MFANTIYTTGEDRCHSGSRLDLHANLHAMLHAMSGGRGDPEDRPGEGSGRHGGPGRHGGHRHRGGPRGGGFGGGPFGGLGSGPRGRGRKARRGDIRTAALLLLNEEPRNGYQIMQEVEERSDGVWRPSPGSVYPALQQLEDEGLIRSEELDGRKLFQLTDAGRAYVEERGEDKPAPWEQMSGDVSDQVHELGKLMREVAFAFTQVVRTGSEGQIGEARKVLAAARKDLYRILADGEPEGATVDDA
jgi:DNA-binding PadR family transcriptional regulator